MKKRAAPTRWHKLDNTANIFPVVASRRYSNVFRLTAVMREAVDPALLQQALEQTLPYFAAFNVRLRHGLFWNYLETNRATPQIRVHLETFHVLTDGTGAMQFLKAVCYRYCQLAHPDAFTPEQLATPYGTETAGEVQDGYLKHYVPAKSKTFREPGAYHLRGEHRIAGGLDVATALMPVDALKAEPLRRHRGRIPHSRHRLRRVRRIHGLQRRKKARQHLCPGESAAYLRHRDVPEFLFQPDDHPAAGAPRRPL